MVIVTTSNNAQATADEDFVALKSHGFSDDDIWDIAAITAFFGLSNPMVNRRNKRFQMLDQDLSQALSTLVTHQEESPISPWDEQLICYNISRSKRCLLDQNII